MATLSCCPSLFCSYSAQGDRASERVGEWSYGAHSDVFVARKDNGIWWPAIVVHKSKAHDGSDLSDCDDAPSSMRKTVEREKRGVCKAPLLYPRVH